MRYTTILFDLDGTLTRSEEGITRSALYACERMGFGGHTREEFKAFIGPPLFSSFKDIVGMTDEQAAQAVVYYRERFSSVGWAENEVYPGIPALLRSLKKNGARMAIATAKPQEFAVRIAERFGLAPYLDAVVGTTLETREASKAEIVAKAAKQLGGTPVMVGDRRYDVEGAREAGVDCVGVTFGYGSCEELKQAGTAHIAESARELGDILLGDAPRARGVFLSMEGVDGCGKTTQRETLVRHLEQNGWEVVVTREPGGDALAEKIRALLLDPENRAMCPETEAYLYAAGRAQNVRAVVRPALERGALVVADRFVDSSVAYQGGGRGLGEERVAALNALAVDGTLPDITVYLRMPPAEALSRRLRASQPDRLEREKADFFERAHAAYEERLAGLARTATVNAAQAVEDVARDMLAAVDERLAALAL